MKELSIVFTIVHHVQVRLVSRKAAALRDAEKSTASAEETKVKKEQQLQEAKDAKVG